MYAIRSYYERMSEGVVDALEAVDVHEHQRHLGAAPLCLGEGMAEPVLEQGPVGQAGERIMVGHMPDLALGALALDDSYNFV